MEEDYLIRTPPEGTNITFPPGIKNEKRVFGCYEAVLKAGLRFPVHPAIDDILAGYGIGLWQLTPNSWTNILGYVATCEAHNVTADFAAFAHMHHMNRTPQGAG